MEEKHTEPEKEPDYFLDITKEACPITFVRTKLLLERMKPGEILEVRLQGEEPLGSVPAAVTEMGSFVLKLVPDDTSHPDGVHSLWIKKA